MSAPTLPTLSHSRSTATAKSVGEYSNCRGHVAGEEKRAETRTKHADNLSQEMMSKLFSLLNCQTVEMFAISHDATPLTRVRTERW